MGAVAGSGHWGLGTGRAADPWGMDAAAYQRLAEDLRAVQRGMADMRASADSPDGLITVTVGSRGAAPGADPGPADLPGTRRACPQPADPGHRQGSGRPRARRGGRPDPTPDAGGGTDPRFDPLLTDLDRMAGGRTVNFVRMDTAATASAMDGIASAGRASATRGTASRAGSSRTRPPSAPGSWPRRSSVGIASRAPVAETADRLSDAFLGRASIGRQCVDDYLAADRAGAAGFGLPRTAPAPVGPRAERSGTPCRSHRRPATWGCGHGPMPWSSGPTPTRTGCGRSPPHGAMRPGTPRRCASSTWATSWAGPTRPATPSAARCSRLFAATQSVGARCAVLHRRPRRSPTRSRRPSRASSTSSSRTFRRTP